MAGEWRASGDEDRLEGAPVAPGTPRDEHRRPCQLDAARRRDSYRDAPSKVLGSAVGAELAAGEEGGVVAGEEEGGSGDLVRLADPLHRDQLDLRTRRRIAYRGRHAGIAARDRSVGQARADHVDADALRREL